MCFQRSWKCAGKLMAKNKMCSKETKRAGCSWLFGYNNPEMTWRTCQPNGNILLNFVSAWHICYTLCSKLAQPFLSVLKDLGLDEKACAICTLFQIRFFEWFLRSKRGKHNSTSPQESWLYLDFRWNFDWYLYGI